MRLAYVVGTFPNLSETFVVNEIERLSQMGVDIEVFAFARPPASDQKKMGAVARRWMQRTHYVEKPEAASALLAELPRVPRTVRAFMALHGGRPRSARTLLELGRAAAVARRLRALGIGHLHAHWPYATRVAHLTHLLTGIPYSVSVHAHEVAHENTHFPEVFGALEFAAFCNRGAMGYLLDRLPPPLHSRAHLVYHGVDIDGFAPLPSRGPDGSLRVLSAGRLTATKGFERLIRGCALARRQGLDVSLTILGRGPREAELREVAAQESFEPHLALPGWVSHEEVAAELARCDVFGLLADTTFHDGLPNVVLEAMASARPVILSPLPAAPEAVDDGVEGFVVESSEDLAGFVAALRRFAEAPDLARRMGVSARARVERDHDAQRQIEVMLELFRRAPAAV